MPSKPVEQWNSRGERVMLFYSIAQAAEALGYSYHQIYAALRNKTKLGRHYLTYFGERPSLQSIQYKLYRHKGDEVDGFISMKEAAIITGVAYKRISALVDTAAKDKDGYYWSHTPPKIG